MRNELIEKCKMIAERQHSNQYRRDGVTPYFVHIEDVVNRLEKMMEPFLVGMDDDHMISPGPVELICVAYLHDCFEDTDLTEDSLRKQLSEFEPVSVEFIIKHVNKLTHSSDEDYFDYIRQLAPGPNPTPYRSMISMVKVSDIISNLSDDPSKKQVKKYSKALSIIFNMEH